MESIAFGSKIHLQEYSQFLLMIILQFIKKNLLNNLICVGVIKILFMPKFQAKIQYGL